MLKDHSISIIKCLVSLHFLSNANKLCFTFLTREPKVENNIEKAGAELGQAQFKLELEVYFTSFKIC